MNNVLPEHIDLDNPELQQALQIIQFTHRSLFLTGKAGTGKSTFLRYICQTTKKKHVVLAPTGIAAINAGGTTLHSFFKLPFHPLLPNDTRYNARNIRETLKYNSEKRKILREVELIIIDEISMVRADIIDFIDKVLRIYTRNMRQPFGGKQLLLVGDIYQLEPVLKEEDRQFLRPFYPSGFFFDAHIFREFQLVSIELKKVYRQTDPLFISILDHIRTSEITEVDLRMLNQRVDAPLSSHQVGEASFRQASTTGAAEPPSFGGAGGGLTITLSTRRDTVDYINERRLEALPSDPCWFVGEIKGEFPESNLPTPKELQLKVGAQIIFIKNDMEHRWVNGTLGTIVAIDPEAEILYVDTEDGEEFEVARDRWANVRYTFNEKEQKIEEEEIGVYIQFPVRLAWAITVHKSQGLTFRQVKIDLSGGAFAGGQTYVALSRCTSLEGITLKEPIRRQDVFVRPEVKQFARHYNDRNIINTALSESKADAAYHHAVRAFDTGDYDEFLKQFFIAIHARYDIEKPIARRLIRRKLNAINALRHRINTLEEEKRQRDEQLKKLAAEYTLLGKECEKEHMPEAAMANYRKAIDLCPDAAEPKRRLKKLERNTKKP